MRLVIGGIYQGREGYARKQYGNDISIYRGLLTELEQGQNVAAILQRALASQVVIAEEPYCGLTAVEADERRLWEEYGQLLKDLATEADSVERVVCGIAQRLK